MKCKKITLSKPFTERHLKKIKEALTKCSKFKELAEAIAIVAPVANILGIGQEDLKRLLERIRDEQT